MNVETEPDGERSPKPAPPPVAAEAAIHVEVNDTQACLRVDRSALADLARATLRGEGVQRATISIAVVNNATIHDLNRRHLNHDWPTDVITFRLSDPGEAELSAELILSAEMAATTAAEAGTDPHAELALYLVHGLLHLCGYDDQTEPDARSMRRREAEVLARAGLPNTFPTTGPADFAGAGEDLR